MANYSRTYILNRKYQKHSRIPCGFDYFDSLQNGCYGVYDTKHNLEILRKCNGINLPLTFYHRKNKKISFEVELKKYTFRKIEDEELAYLTEKYNWEPVRDDFSTDWYLLIEFDVKDIVFPKELKEESNKITNYFQKT
jgi:hypothetical protein